MASWSSLVGGVRSAMAGPGRVSFVWLRRW